MTHSASEIVESYLSRLRSELDAAGAPDTDDLVAEIRSLLAEAAADDPEAAVVEIARLGEPAQLARNILAERGLDVSAGMSTGVWWRLGLAAPIDIVIGLALPLAAAFPLVLVAATGQPRTASIVVATLLAVATLAWPLFIWRPWRQGGRALSPGMTLTGVAVVRAPGSWRIVRIGEMEALGLAPRRRTGGAAVVALVAAVLLVGTMLLGYDAAGTWLVSSAMSADVVAGAPGASTLSVREARATVVRLYGTLSGALQGDDQVAAFGVASEAATKLKALATHVDKLGIQSAGVNSMTQVAPGVYRLAVVESRAWEPRSEQVGFSTITVGRRYWVSADGGSGADWVVLGIKRGAASGAK